ncbi:MAG: AtpZ/AtpI family protein [Bacillota bacterium]|nr:AtpZ/AtpI family protein [Bacillota bacterium]
MNEKKKNDGDNGSKENELSHAVGKKATRRLKARRAGDRGIWFGMGMFGMVGWTIAITTIIGLVIGLWIDRTWPGQYSWTLTLLIIGLIVGCINAWYWVNKESHLGDDYEERSNKREE